MAAITKKNLKKKKKINSQASNRYKQSLVAKEKAVKEGVETVKKEAKKAPSKRGKTRPKNKIVKAAYVSKK